MLGTVKSRFICVCNVLVGLLVINSLGKSVERAIKLFSIFESAFLIYVWSVISTGTSATNPLSISENGLKYIAGICTAYLRAWTCCKCTESMSSSILNLLSSYFERAMTSNLFYRLLAFTCSSMKCFSASIV